MAFTSLIDDNEEGMSVCFTSFFPPGHNSRKLHDTDSLLAFAKLLQGYLTSI